jgi:hypothetical protein
MYNVMYIERGARMGRMVRKQIYIKPEQEEMLKRQAESMGISEAEIIRRRLQEPGAVTSRPRNPVAWQEELAAIKQRAAALPGLNKPRIWTREELYEERLGRRSR